MRSVIAFDMDGVLVDSRSSINQSLNVTLSHFGFPEVDPDGSSLIGLPLREMMKAATNNQMTDEQIKSATPIYRQVNDELGSKTTIVYPEMQLVLSKLALNYDLIVVTSKLQQSARELLSSLAIDKHFVGIFGPESDGSTEDKSQTLIRAENVLQASTAQQMKIIALVGDRASDIKAARCANIQSIGVKWGYGSDNELTTADFLADNPKQLLEYFLQQQ